MSRPILATVTFVMCTIMFTWQVAELTRDWTLQSLHKKGSDQLLQAISQLRSVLDEYRYLPFLISQNTDVKSLMLQANDAKSAEVSLYLEQTNLVAGTSSLFVLSSEGRPLAYSHWRDQQNFFLKSHQTQGYFKQTRSGQRGRQFILNESTQRPAYFYLRLFMKEHVLRVQPLCVSNWKAWSISCVHYRPYCSVIKMTFFFLPPGH